MRSRQSKKPSATLVWVGTLAFFGVLVWAFLRPPPAALEGYEWRDSAFHLLAFFGATLLLLYATSHTKSLRRLTPLVPFVMTGAGLGIEVAQEWLTTEHDASWWDVGVNGAGAFVASLIWRQFRR